MDHTTMLTDVLKLHFGWNLARIKCLSCLIIALFKVKTVNFGPRSWDRPLYAFRGGFKGAGASSTDSKIAANIERGF